MKRPVRAHRLICCLGASVLTVSGLAAGQAGAEESVDAADHVTIRPNPSYQGDAFEGWGTSLVWFANATGDYPDEIREELADLVFGEDGLNLNIARYNVGGGNAPDVTDYLRAGGAVEGWWRAPEGTTRDDIDWWSADDPADWNPDADATQRWWVDRIKDDIDHWEAFSNSPPWFMTVSGYVSGGFDSSADQLRTDSVDDFAAYLVGAVDRLERAHGIDVDTIDPFNEPNTPYWGTRLGEDGEPVGGRQEGAHMGPELQQQVIRALAEELDSRGTRTDAVIAAMDETNPGTFARNWAAYPSEVRELVEQLNVHTYGTGSRTTVRDLAKAAETPLWMSEVEGDWGDGQDFESMQPGLGLARHMVDDLRELEPSAWVFWQPVEDYDNMRPGGESERGGNWGSIQLSFSCTEEDTLESCPIYTNQKFNTARNFTHYIEPGDRLVQVDDPASTAAVSADGRGATVVHVNDGDVAREVTLDLSAFGRVARDATVTPVVTSADGALVEQDPIRVTDRAASYTVPADSVTTFVVDGVSGVAGDAAAFQPGHEYRLGGVQSGRALTVSDDGTGVVIRTADESRQDQLWRVERRGERYVVTSAVDGRRLAERVGAPVLERDRGRPDRAAQWIASSTGDGTWTFVNAATGNLLEVGGQATADNSPVTTWPPNSGANQRWAVSE
ncbi:ricin-type beta-trefoil lectin domain protein [Streptomyces sp. 8K308]|uniref:glycoside hydrolase n=1 Tax=Streptomyces sp. 8K308 TaxID=2530388 RepID=UPI00104522C8|nr:glycoside hydrolase [Streptomyces sp. 8K308]TDC23333.1 ricin-type beta-trefoil lectin domain protein [Streptomyces sp. 8K308]